MKKILVVAVMAMLAVTMLTGSVMAGAPNSGDGVPDGSGFWDCDIDEEDCTEDVGFRLGNFPLDIIKGPAPNAGDGISDGPGW